MDARSIIAKLRDGVPVNTAELNWFAHGLASGQISDAQAGAFAMAAVIRGLGEEGRVSLTKAMRDSGQVLEWEMDAPVVDKHSTGGIGDCVSLLLAPMLAAVGVYVPMISGRGLGHTGGTLDKLEAIPGLRTEYSEDELRAIVSGVGCAIVAATGDLAPADQRLYAVRDVTSTVESIDLITASILSKKLASGIETLVLDVKVGSGAFMSTTTEAMELAQALVETARGAGCNTRALITDMNQPLASSAGNALEVAEVVDVLTGKRVSARLADLSVELGGEILAECGMAANTEEGARQMRATLRDGSAAEKFAKMVAQMGGPADFVDQSHKHLPAAKMKSAVTSEKSGFVRAIDGRALGMAVVRLGGGRLKGGDQIDPSVGLSNIIRLGQKVAAGDMIATIHASDEESSNEALHAVLAAVTIGDEPVEPPSLFQGRVV